LDAAHDAAGLTSANTAANMQERSIAEAIERFLRSKGTVDLLKGYHGDVEFATFRKYRCCLDHLKAFCEREGITALAELTLDYLEDYRASRTIAPVTWRVELQALRTFFAHCATRKWITTNPAKELKGPRHLKPNEIVPYTLQEESIILAACDQIGGGKYHRSGPSYEQLRAKAMIMLLRHTALRISDVATLRKDSVSWDTEKSTWRILVRTQKTGDPVFLPIPETLKLTLDALPLPRNAAQDCPYFFWNGLASRRAVVGIAERSQLRDRGRHPGETTPEVVRRHYGKWSKGRQDNIDRLMMAHFQSAAVTNPVTRESHEKLGAVN
jgi:integrase